MYYPDNIDNYSLAYLTSQLELSMLYSNAINIIIHLVISTWNKYICVYSSQVFTDYLPQLSPYFTSRHGSRVSEVISFEDLQPKGWKNPEKSD